MFIIDHVKPEDATGKVAEAYGAFPPQVPVPAPLQLMSASPELAVAQSQIIRHYVTHEKLDAGLLGLIRYLSAHEFGYQFCINFNSGLLQQAGGFSAEELAAIQQNPEQAPLEESQKALLLFVLKVLKTPDAVDQGDITPLRDLGWSDQEIFEAAYHGASMATPATLFKAFAE